jgi:hypothetical protein
MGVMLAALGAAPAASARPVAGLATPAMNACTGVWEVQASPSPGQGDNTLFAVSALDASSVWAVGYHRIAAGVDQTLSEHWDGGLWTPVQSPNLGKNVANWLYDSAAVSSSDVWAVGYHYVKNPLANQSLTEHWDGSQWAIVRSPNLGKDSNFLYSVSAASASDVWAVGYYVRGGVYQTLTMHWNGSSWTILPSPNVGTGDNFLFGVAAIAADDAWAVGFGGVPAQTLTLHWDGVSWTRVASPDPGTGPLLLSVSAASSTDVWAVGVTNTPEEPLIEHWDGSLWAVVPSPNIVSYGTNLRGVAAVSSSLAWAVGWYIDPGTSAGRTFIEKWDGIVWTIEPSPNVGAMTNNLYGAAAASTADAWAVGQEYDSHSASYHTLVLHFC